MEGLSVALRHVSQAVSLDSNGFQQAAFSKYINCLQVLASHLNSTFTTSGFEKMLEKKKEIVQVLSMINKCSERIGFILNDYDKPVSTPKFEKPVETNPEVKDFHPKISAFEKVRKENSQLFKTYQSRLNNTSNKVVKTNLNLEFQRRVAENAVLAKKNYDTAIKQLQNERMQFMEKEIRKLSQTTCISSKKEQEKFELYYKVLEYVKAEMWPCSWKLNCHDLSAYEMAEKVFQKVIRCYDHPLSQWLILTHTNIKKKIEAVFEDYSEYICFLPELKNGTELKYYTVQEHTDCIVIKLSHSESATAITTSRMSHLENILESISSEIRSAITEAADIFHLVYKSLLPDDSETICYYVLEKHSLKELWPNLSVLFRILNIASESKLSESMDMHRKCNPCKFGRKEDNRLCIEMRLLLQSVLQQHSLVRKLKTLVQVSKKISEFANSEDACENKLGADEMIPLLSYVILQSNLPFLISECNMLESLFDIKYMLGEEGYALTSFLGALKCVEMMKLTECENK